MVVTSVNWYLLVDLSSYLHKGEIMTTADIRTDDKKNQPSAFQRKMARQRPAFLSQDVLDKVVREHTSYFKAMSMDKNPSP